MVRLGVDGHRFDTQLPAGSNDPHGDLAAIGDEDSAEHSTLASVDQLGSNHMTV